MTVNLVKHNGAVAVEYPYGLAQLQRDHPNVIFTLPLTEQSIADFDDVSPVDPVERPEVDSLLEDVFERYPVLQGDRWVQVFEVVEVSPEEQERRYNAQANWQQFYGGLLINPAFVRARAGAAEVLAINAAYTDAVGALGLAVQGVVNVPAIQACFDNLMAVMQGDFALDQSQKDGLQALVDACFLDRLITLNWNAPVVN